MFLINNIKIIILFQIYSTRIVHVWFSILVLLNTTSERQSIDIIIFVSYTKFVTRNYYHYFYTLTKNWIFFFLKKKNKIYNFIIFESKYFYRFYIFRYLNVIDFLFFVPKCRKNKYGYLYIQIGFNVILTNNSVSPSTFFDF